MIDPRLFSILFLFVLPAAVLLLVYFRLCVKRARREGYLERMKVLFEEAGATRVADGIYRRGDRYYEFDAILSPVFSRQFSLRLSTYCDSVYEFVAKDVHEEMADELANYLAAVKDPLERIFPKRWSAFSKQHVELVLGGNRFDDEDYSVEDIRGDLDTLDALAAVPLRRPVEGGVVTWRSGFEKNVPHWQWKPEQRARLPEKLERFVFSYWLGDPLLHAAIVDVLFRLAGGGRKQFLTDRHDVEFLRYCFGDVYSISGDVFETDHAEALEAADLYLDGHFFQGMIVTDEDVSAKFNGLNRYFFHDTALDFLPGSLLYARRLLDQEASWYHGEYEIVTTQIPLEKMVDTLTDVANKHGARVEELDRPFNKRLLKHDII